MLMKRISLQFSALLAALFLFAFSCDDHVVPEEPDVPEPSVQIPAVQTLALSIENQNLNQYRYKLNIENLGNVQITGYGVVFSAEFNSNAPFTNTPTIANDKVVFPMPASTGEKSKVDAAPPIGYKTIYYRAFVTYGVNSVAYGNVMEFSPAALKTAVIEIANAIGPGAPPIIVQLDVKDFGELPIEEYGVVYSFLEDIAIPVNPTPTVLDHKHLFTTPAKLGTDNIGVLPNNTISDLYIRTYVKHTNGAIVYGEVEHFK
jgi:hypothetical protein